MNWCNPPYNNQKVFLNKAYKEFYKNNNNTICLIPSRTDTKLYQDLIFKYAPYICFLKGRLKFENCQNSAPFPSALIIFVKYLNKEQINYLNTIGKLIIINN